MKDNPLILSVDRNHKNLELLTFLGREGYQVLAVSSIEEFEQALMHSKEINLALVDIAGERSPDLGEMRSPADGKYSFSCAFINLILQFNNKA